LLNKECIIYTYQWGDLLARPKEVERVYGTYARTHVALGNTTDYVKRMVQYVSGKYEPAFIGCVAGEFGQGKTSFLVHTWYECVHQGVLCVPPFKLDRSSRCVHAISEWVAYVLRDEHAELARKAQAIGVEHQESALKDIARLRVKESGRDYEEALLDLEKLNTTPGVILDLERPPSDFLDFLDALSTIVKKAGWKGLLVLLDETELAANLQGLSVSKVFDAIFGWADGLGERKGDYGIFLSMPENFLSKMMNQFPATVSRLEKCNCLVRLGDLYGRTFAKDLWDRYTKEFKLGQLAEQIVSPYTLEAIGQVGSSERGDLSFGPRTVVSAFKQMVQHFQQMHDPYQPRDFVEDCLADNILVSPDYRTRVKRALESPEAQQVGKDALLTLAAFPNVLTDNMAKAIGMADVVASLRTLRTFAHRVGDGMRLAVLEKQTGGNQPQDELHDLLADLADAYSPGPATFVTARKAFIENVLPRLFAERGTPKSLQGWNKPTIDDGWRPLGETTLVATYTGSFIQTEKIFPWRTVLVTVGDPSDDIDSIYKKAAAISDTKSVPDLVVQFCLRWNPETAEHPRRISIGMGEDTAKHRRAAQITLFLDLTRADASDGVSSVYPDVTELFRSGLGALYALGSVEGTALQRDAQAAWGPLREQTLRQLVQQLLGVPELLAEAEEISGQKLPGDAVALIGSIAKLVLLQRYPNYCTLIRQTEWEKRLGDYINALNSAVIPLAAKREREPWYAPTSQVATALGTGPMSLLSWFSGFEDLLKIDEPEAKGKPASVHFRIHPHEKRIMEMVNSSQEPRRQIEGKTCCWAPYSAVKLDLVYAGYCEKEVEALVNIGKARGTFEFRDEDGEKIVYCRPLDPRQMADLCKSQLGELQVLQAQFLKLPKAIAVADVESLTRKTLYAKTEEDFDAVLLAIKTARQTLEVAVPAQFMAFQMQLSPLASKYDTVRQQMNSNSLIQEVKTQQKAASTWVSGLNDYVAVALAAQIEKLRTRSGELSSSLSKLRAVESNPAPDTPASEIERLLQANTDLETFRNRLDEFSTGWTQMSQYLKDYDEWVRLLVTSDNLRKALVGMKMDPNHKQKGVELLDDFEALSSEIVTQLQSCGIVMLGAHGQYETSIGDIDTKRRQYLAELRSEFEKCKLNLSEFTSSLAASESSRARETFNPDDITSSYARLKEETIESARSAVKSELEELISNMRELCYARDVLEIAPGPEAEPLAKAVQEAMDSLGKLLPLVSQDWIDAMMKSTEAADQAVEVVESGRQANRTARKTIDGWEVHFVRPEPSKDAQGMLRLLSSQGRVDLKQLVLELIAAGTAPKDALDKTLGGLSELFRSQFVDVEVKPIGSRDSSEHETKRAK
jgi:hypothetical protein